MTTIYQLEADLINGNEKHFVDYKDKVLLIVNTASKCGFTPQFAGLEKLHQAYHDKGLEVLGFPCNQFGGQDPGTLSEIGSFCKKNYGVSFTMFSKVDVKGRDAHPIFRFLTREAKGVLGSQNIKWNFTKFLVGRDGQVLQRYAPTTKPETLHEDIERALST
ncbi:glutathione peroxidase [Acinetobacter apis]|uniref:Glutathione peroxidase n=1 Tax=Acinetobacter apis TaxID=1229165 RepID=A0A217EE72_9GAMM|nr:glutathione peroxidase [Acinetobacter apis]SNQ28552.1 glutathione peroxidase [Acinetobacter apis]